MENTQASAKTTKLKLDFKDSKYATGRRKTSIAKVWPGCTGNQKDPDVPNGTAIKRLISVVGFFKGDGGHIRFRPLIDQGTNISNCLVKG